MKTSIIIPTLNRQKYLKNCLTSILENTRKPTEIIIVEQGDLKKTQKIKKVFEKKLKLTIFF